jgi:uncharacterized protein
MAKAPLVGRVKTRLSPFLTPEEAHQLGCCFLRDITANLAVARKSVAFDPYVAFAPAGSEPAFAGTLHPGTELLLADGSEPTPNGVTGLGRCLHQAMVSLFGCGYGMVVLLNADSPDLPTSRLVDALRLLDDGRRAVLGPCTDGGYYLIGMNCLEPNLFRNIAWSTDRVTAQTRERAAETGLDLIDLPPWYDVDDWNSLRKLLADSGSPPSARSGAYAAPVTRRFLQTINLEERMPVSLGAAAQEQV